MTCSTHRGQNNNFVKQMTSSVMEFPVHLNTPSNPAARDEVYCIGSIQFKGARGALQAGRSLF